MSRLEDLRELAEALKPQVLSTHSEHGLQGVSGLVGQYRACLAEIEELEAKQPSAGTVLDELKERRAASKQAPRKGGSARAK